MIDSKMSSIFLNFKFFDTPAEPRLVSFDISYEIAYEVSFEVIWYQMRLFDIKWAHMSSNDVSYELKWHLIWAQMTPHMSSNETHLRFGKGRHRTAMCVCVNPNHPRSSYRSPAYYQHSREIEMNMKIQNPIIFSHLRSQMRNRSLSVVENRWKNRCYEKKSSFPKIKSYDPYGDQIWAPNSSPAPRYLQKQNCSFFPEKNFRSWIDWFWSLNAWVFILNTKKRF